MVVFIMLLRHWNLLKQNKQMLLIFGLSSIFLLWIVIESTYYYAYDNLLNCLPMVCLLVYCFFGYPNNRLKSGYSVSIILHLIIWIYFFLESSTFRHYELTPFSLGDIPDFVINEQILLLPHILFFLLLSITSFRRGNRLRQTKKIVLIIAAVFYCIIVLSEIFDLISFISFSFDIYFLFFDYLFPLITEGGYWLALCLLLPMSIEKKAIQNDITATQEVDE